MGTSDKDGTRVRNKKKMSAFHTSQHVTNPPQTWSEPAPVRKGHGETNQSQHAFSGCDPDSSRASRPTCGGSSTASERGTAANALYACLTFMGNSSGEVGEGAQGCREEGAGWGGWRAG